MMASDFDQPFAVGSAFWRERLKLAFIQISIGGLLCLLDAKYESITIIGATRSGWSVDFLNDTLGVLLLMLGLNTFWHVPGSPAFARRIRLAYSVAAVALLLSVESFFVYKAPGWWLAVKNIWGIARLAGVIAFVQAMVLLCKECKLESATAAWTRTLRLFWLLYVLPLAVIYALVLANLAGARIALHSDSAVLVFGILGVLCVPLISLIVAAKATLAQWDSAAGQDAANAAVEPAVLRESK